MEDRIERLEQIIKILCSRLDIKFDIDLNTICNFCNYKDSNNKQCCCCNKFLCSECEYMEIDLCPKCRYTQDGINHQDSINREKFHKFKWIGEKIDYVKYKMYDLFDNRVSISFVKNFHEALASTNSVIFVIDDTGNVIKTVWGY